MASILKDSGGLFSTSEEEKRKLTGQPQLQPGQLPPQSPGGAASMGASPDSAKMTGSSAQKTSAIRAAGAPPAQDINRAQRLTAPTPTGPTDAVKAAQEKADRLKQMSSIDMQVQGMIEQRMQQMQAQQFNNLQINQQAIQQVDETQRPGVQAALEAFRTAPDENARQQALQQLQNATGNAALTAEGVYSYFQGGPEAFRQFTSQILPENVKLGALPQFAEQYDVNQLAADLNTTPEDLANLTLPELQQKIQDVEAQNFNKMQTIDAELMTATGARRQALLAEKQQLTAMGVTGIEASIDTLQQSIDAAGSVKVAGEDMALADILSDDKLSDLIVSVAGDQKALEEMKANNDTKALAEWIEANSQTLNSIGQSYRQTTRDYAAIQEQAAKAMTDTGASEELFTAVMGPKPKNFTAEEWATYQSEMASNPIFQALAEDDFLKEQLNLTPSAAAALQKMSKSNILTLSAASQQVRDNPVVSGLTGFEPGKLLTSLDDAAKVNKAIAVAAAVQGNESIIGSDLFKKEFQADNITPEIATQIATTPGMWDEILATDAANKSLQKLGDNPTGDQLASFLTGGQDGVTMDTINNSMANVAMLAKLGDKDAAATLKLMQQYFGPDGKLGPEDAAAIKALVQATGGTLSDVVAGKKSFADILGEVGAGLNKAASATSSDVGIRGAAGILADGVITSEELANADDKTLAVLATTPEGKKQAGGEISSRRDKAQLAKVNNYMNTFYEKNLAPLIANPNGFPAVNKIRVQDGVIRYSSIPAGKTINEYKASASSVAAMIKVLSAQLNNFLPKGSVGYNRLVEQINTLEKMEAGIERERKLVEQKQAADEDKRNKDKAAYDYLLSAPGIAFSARNKKELRDYLAGNGPRPPWLDSYKARTTNTGSSGSGSNAGQRQ